MNTVGVQYVGEVEAEILAKTELEPAAEIRSRPILVLVKSGIFGGLCLLPVIFGGVHPICYLLAQATIFSLFAALLFKEKKILLAVFGPGTSSRLVINGAFVLVIYVALQTIFLGSSTQDHPVLGLVSRIPNRDALIQSVLFVLFMAATFGLMRCYLGLSRTRIRTLVNLICAISAVVAVIALAHWFYDNGKLFWILSPDTVAVSFRARWPFVNPNHLAHFLLPAIFLIFASIVTNLTKVSEQFLKSTVKKGQSSMSITSSSRFQKQLVGAFFRTIILLTMIIAILGSGSRSSWLGISIGTLSYIGLSLFRNRAGQSAPRGDLRFEQQAQSSSRGANRPQHRRHSSKRSTGIGIYMINWFSRAAKPSLFGVALIALLFFLSGRGAELIQARIDYSLTNSKDDIRWLMFSNSLQILRSHPLIGVGFGGWSEVFPVYAASHIAGLNPVYLHSDPLQLLVEVGFLGFIIPLYLAWRLVKLTLRKLPELEPEHANLIIALLSGVVALGTASTLDFPFRIPAISFFMCAYLALMATIVDQHLWQVGERSARLDQITDL